MTSGHPSPLALAREFEKFKASIANHTAETKTLTLLDFWSRHESQLLRAENQVYADQCLALCETEVSAEAIADFAIDELRSLRNLISKLIERNPADSEHSKQALETVTKHLATVLFYVGDIPEALPLCAELSNVVWKAPVNIDDLKDLDPFESLTLLLDRCRETVPDLCAILSAIHKRWLEILNGESDNSVFCALVKRDGANNRGHLQKLSGKVFIPRATRNRDDEHDLLSFDHPIRDAQGHYETAVRNALRAVRAVVKRFGVNTRGLLSAHFMLPERDRELSGASIGLATGLIGFTQLLHTEVFRHERFISSSVAVTGGIDERGLLQPVNTETLKHKIERVFFSPLKYFALPDNNLATAKAHLDKLTATYPCRRLLLIGARTLSEVTDNLNVIRTQKVCLGEFAAKTAYKWTRATKVQVPLLVASLLLLLALLLPRFFNPFFDRNPAQVEQVGNGFKVLNADGDLLWEKELDCEGMNAIVATFFDLDADGANEVALRVAADGKCRLNSRALIYTSNGDSVLLSLDGTKPGKYPPRDEKLLRMNGIQTLLSGADTFRTLVTVGQMSNPSQSHVKLWEANGKEKSWYINAGGCGYEGHVDLNHDGREELLFAGTNRRMQSACFFGISPDSTYGASPPYRDSSYELDWVERGNQLYYVIFPPTEIFLLQQNPVNHSVVRLIVESPETVRINTFEWSSDDPQFYEKSTIQYYMHFVNGQIRVSRVDFSDSFSAIYQRMCDSGRLERLSELQYKAVLAKRVKYWIDSGWATEGQLRAAGAADPAKSGK